MKKLFWVALGIGIGALAARQLSKARSASPLAAADSALDKVSSFVENATSAFKDGMNARESELKAALGLEDAPRGRHSDSTQR